jgi:hypothetical protein
MKKKGRRHFFLHHPNAAYSDEQRCIKKFGEQGCIGKLVGVKKKTGCAE